MYSIVNLKKAGMK